MSRQANELSVSSRRSSPSCAGNSSSNWRSKLSSIGEQLRATRSCLLKRCRTSRPAIARLVMRPARRTFSSSRTRSGASADPARNARVSPCTRAIICCRSRRGHRRRYLSRSARRLSIASMRHASALRNAHSPSGVTLTSKGKNSAAASARCARVSRAPVDESRRTDDRRRAIGLSVANSRQAASRYERRQCRSAARVAQRVRAPASGPWCGARSARHVVERRPQRGPRRRVTLRCSTRGRSASPAGASVIPRRDRGQC